MKLLEHCSICKKRGIHLHIGTISYQPHKICRRKMPSKRSIECKEWIMSQHEPGVPIVCIEHCEWYRTAWGPWPMDYRDLFPPGGNFFEARLTSRGGNSTTIASILLASTSRMRPRGQNSNPGWARKGGQAERGGTSRGSSLLGRYEASKIIRKNPGTNSYIRT